MPPPAPVSSVPQVKTPPEVSRAEQLANDESKNDIPVPEEPALMVSVSELASPIVLFPVELKVVNVPAAAVVPPITAPLMVPPTICPPVTNTLPADCVAIVPKPDTSDADIANNVLTSVVESATGVAGLPVLLPIKLFAAKLAILDKLTFPEPIVIAPVLSMDTSPVTDTAVARPEPFPTIIFAEVREVEIYGKAAILAALIVPNVAELMAVIADCPAESVFAKALAVVAVVAVVAEPALPEILIE